MISDRYKKLIEMNKAPSKEENEALIKRVLDGDRDAIWETVIKNCRLVVLVLNRSGNKYYRVTDESFSDGLFGFYKAVKRIKNDTTVSRLLTYGRKYIYGHICDGIRERESQFKKNTNRKFNVIEIPRNSDAILDSDSWLNITGDDIYESIEDKLDREERIKCFRYIINNFYNDKRFKIFRSNFERLCVLTKNDGALEKTAKEMGIKRQYIHLVRNKCKNHIIDMLNKEPKLMKDFNLLMGTKLKVRSKNNEE